MTIGEQIKKYRVAAGISQKELGKRMGVSAAMVAQYENDLRKPKPETIQRFADALQVEQREIGNEGVAFNLDDQIEKSSVRYKVQYKRCSDRDHTKWTAFEEVLPLKEMVHLLQWLEKNGENHKLITITQV